MARLTGPSRKETGMKTLLISLFLAAWIAIPGFSQNPRPTPTPADDEVVKISTNLIQIDVAVTDANGNAVLGLKPDEIEIYENGKKQKITNFSFVSSGSREPAKVSGPAKEIGKIPVPQPMPGPISPASVRRTIAIVV